MLQKRRLLDLKVSESDLKTKTKIEKRTKVIESSPELQLISDAMEGLSDELTMLEGTVSYFIELINAFKRELTRREKELEWSRYERRGNYS